MGADAVAGAGGGGLLGVVHEMRIAVRRRSEWAAWVDGPVSAIRSGYRLRGNQGVLSDSDEG